MTADQIASALDLPPDDASVRRSTRKHPAVPAMHIWSVHCRERGVALDDQVDRIVERLDPVGPAIGNLVRGGGVDARPVFVRLFNDEEGEEEDVGEVILPDGRRLDHLEGQHQLLGWILSQKTVAWLGRWIYRRQQRPGAYGVGRSTVAATRFARNAFT